MATTFDAAAYKESTRQQWDEAAEAWHRWGPFLEEWLGEATELMLDLAGVVDGARVLDVAAGAGGQTIGAARRVGPSGAVLATDISERILEHAADEARRQGGSQRPDGQHRGTRRFSCVVRCSYLEPRPHLLPRPCRALARILSALRPGGRFATVTYSVPRATAASPCRSPSSAVGRSCRRRLRVRPAHSALPQRACWTPSSGRPALSMLTCGPSLRRSCLRVPSSVPGFERESSALSTRCSEGSMRADAARRGKRSSKPSASTDPGGLVGPSELLVAAGTRPASIPRFVRTSAGLSDLWHSPRMSERCPTNSERRLGGSPPRSLWSGSGGSSSSSARLSRSSRPRTLRSPARTTTTTLPNAVRPALGSSRAPSRGKLRASSLPGARRGPARARRGRHCRAERLRQVERLRRDPLGGGLAEPDRASRREARRRPLRRRLEPRRQRFLRGRAVVRQRRRDAARWTIAEVSVARRLHRGGEGQYLVNKAPVRRLDLVELLADLGLGQGMHSIISQGKVEAISRRGPPSGVRSSRRLQASVVSRRAAIAPS